LKLVDAKKVLTQLKNDSDNDEEVIYELEKYTEPKPKVLQTVWVVDKEHPNLKVPIRKKI
tara:strand:- start:5 stop:184 length:180 start_codon:yes stop_codon:yes gene_type:complete